MRIVTGFYNLNGFSVCIAILEGELQEGTEKRFGVCSKKPEDLA
ncbi:hypothetical protein [Larkinella sp. C7]|nr:hypothetical protein [Larkinella sp. C7]